MLQALQVLVNRSDRDLRIARIRQLNQNLEKLVNSFQNHPDVTNSNVSGNRGFDITKEIRRTRENVKLLFNCFEGLRNKNCVCNVCGSNFRRCINILV